MPHPNLENVLLAVRSSSAPTGMKTRIIAVDGPGGAGKSSLAASLARELGAPIVHTDDFGSWENLIDWPALIERALKPLAAGESARYTPASWGGPEKDPVVIQPEDFVILEGVSASRRAFRKYLAYSIWIDAPRQLRLDRGLQRDGSEARARWLHWMAEEDLYIQREQPADKADCILPGDQDLWA